jgi:small conductance mechanosensitive channel
MHTIAAATTDWFGTFWTQWHVLIRVLLILVGAILVRWILLFSVRRVVNSVVGGVKVRNNVLETIANEISPIAKARVVQRTRTMGSVLNNFITWTVAIFALTMVLSELGVAIGALAAGAGLVGAGIGFGAQSLVRDLISGLFIVFEDQYGVGDSVNLGEISGAVELVGLRVTQIRDIDGVLWYVRNGEILRVGNHSQGWSRAVVDVALDYNADVDSAKALIEKASGEVASAPDNTLSVIGTPAVWGIHPLSGDQIVIRVVQKTKAGKSDDLARDLRVAITRELDAAGITLASSKATIFVQSSK